MPPCVGARGRVGIRHERWGRDGWSTSTLLGVFAGLVERISASLSPKDKVELDAATGRAREVLGNAAFDEAWAEGGGLSLDRAVELSLTVTVSPAMGPHPT